LETTWHGEVQAALRSFVTYALFVLAVVPGLWGVAISAGQRPIIRVAGFLLLALPGSLLAAVSKRSNRIVYWVRISTDGPCVILGALRGAREVPLAWVSRVSAIGLVFRFTVREPGGVIRHYLFHVEDGAAQLAANLAQLGVDVRRSF
jgi:hypothetical protein